MLENEFTFLVKNLPENLDAYPKDKIKQGYISSGLHPLRIRQKGDKYELTKKSQIAPQDFSRYNETTIYLTQDEFEKLWPLTERFLEKTRYYYPLENGLTAEIDVYAGALKGLVVVEVEFPDENSRKNFKTPSWFGKDITQEHWSANSYLAGKSYGAIEALINSDDNG